MLALPDRHFALEPLQSLAAGFIGGGAILKSRGSVTGTATAASIWTTGLIGIAVAADRFEIALILAVMTFVTLRLGRQIKEKIPESE